VHSAACHSLVLGLDQTICTKFIFMNKTKRKGRLPDRCQAKDSTVGTGTIPVPVPVLYNAGPAIERTGELFAPCGRGSHVCDSPFHCHPLFRL
jgi:hypothetical protein